MRYKNYLYPTFTVHRQKRQPLSRYDAGHLSFTFLPSPQILSHKSTNPTSSSLHSWALHHLVDCNLLEFLWPWLLVPNTGKTPDKMIWPSLTGFVFFSRVLFFSTIAVVPSLSALFVPMWILHVLFPRSALLFPSHARFSVPINKLQLHLPCIHVNPERSFGGTNGEPPSEASQVRKGGPGVLPRKILKTYIANGAIYVIPELYLWILLAYIVIKLA